MSRHGPETAHHNIDQKKYQENYDKIDWGITDKNSEKVSGIRDEMDCKACDPEVNYFCDDHGRDKYIFELQDQLRKANEVIKFYGDETSWIRTFAGAENNESFSATKINNNDISLNSHFSKVGGKRAREYMAKHGVKNEN